MSLGQTPADDPSEPSAVQGGEGVEALLLGGAQHIGCGLQPGKRIREGLGTGSDTSTHQGFERLDLSCRWNAVCDTEDLEPSVQPLGEAVPLGYGEGEVPECVEEWSRGGGLSEPAVHAGSQGVEQGSEPIGLPLLEETASRHQDGLDLRDFGEPEAGNRRRLGRGVGATALSQDALRGGAALPSLRLVGHDPNLHGADADALSGPQRNGTLEALAVEPGAVTAPRVFEDPLRPLLADGGVVSGDEQVVDQQVAGRMAADEEGCFSQGDRFPMDTEAQRARGRSHPSSIAPTECTGGGPRRDVSPRPPPAGWHANIRDLPPST